MLEVRIGGRVEIPPVSARDRGPKEKNLPWQVYRAELGLLGLG